MSLDPNDFYWLQVMRLKGQKFTSTVHPAAWESLRKVLLDNTDSQTHARKVIDQCLMIPELVTGFDLVEIAKATASAAHAAPNGRCGTCNGTGWVHETRLINGSKNDYAGRCRCWRTQEMSS